MLFSASGMSICLIACPACSWSLAHFAIALGLHWARHQCHVSPDFSHRAGPHYSKIAVNGLVLRRSAVAACLAGHRRDQPPASRREIRQCDADCGLRADPRRLRARHPLEDGASAYSTGMHNNANIPIEMIESDTPLTIVRYGLLPDSAGAGAHRGGLGLFREWRVDSAEAIFTANLERFRFRPYGLAGGGAAAPGRLILIRDGIETALRSKVGNLRLVRGDIIRLETSGGGGFGAPGARDPEAVARDVALGYVT